MGRTFSNGKKIYSVDMMFAYINIFDFSIHISHLLIMLNLYFYIYILFFWYINRTISINNNKIINIIIYSIINKII